MNFYLPRKLMVESAKKLKDLFDMNKWYKFMADMLHIPYTDVCCDINKNFTPVRYNIVDEVHEWYNLAEDAWIPFDDGGAPPSINDGEGTTLTGLNMDWGGIITHDVTIDSDDGSPSIIWGGTNDFKSIEFTANDIFFLPADSFDVDSTNIGFTQSENTVLDTKHGVFRASEDLFMGSSASNIGYWHFTIDDNIITQEVGFQIDEQNATYKIGDFNGEYNSTFITVDDNIQKIEISADFGVTLNGSGLIKALNMPEYADNAAAITALLPVGALYRTGDVLKIVH